MGTVTKIAGQSREIKGGGINQITIGTASTAIVAANANRATVILSNPDPKDVFIAVGKDAVEDQGIILEGSGGKIELPAEEFGTGAINGIRGTGASVDISFHEFNKS